MRPSDCLPHIDLIHIILHFFSVHLSCRHLFGILLYHGIVLLEKRVSRALRVRAMAPM